MPIVYYVNIFFSQFCLWIVIPFVESNLELVSQKCFPESHYLACYVCIFIFCYIYNRMKENSFEFWSSWYLIRQFPFCFSTYELVNQILCKLIHWSTRRRKQRMLTRVLITPTMETVKLAKTFSISFLLLKFFTLH